GMAGAGSPATIALHRPSTRASNAAPDATGFSAVWGNVPGLTVVVVGAAVDAVVGAAEDDEGLAAPDAPSDWARSAPFAASAATPSPTRTVTATVATSQRARRARTVRRCRRVVMPTHATVAVRADRASSTGPERRPPCPTSTSRCST